MKCILVICSLNEVRMGEVSQLCNKVKFGRDCKD